MDAKEFFAFLFSLIISLGIIVTIVALGWFCVWKFFLCRFRLVRELLGTASENSSSTSNTINGPTASSSTESSSTSKLNGRRDTRKSTATSSSSSSGTYKSTRSRSRKED